MLRIRPLLVLASLAVAAPAMLACQRPAPRASAPYAESTSLEAIPLGAPPGQATSPAAVIRNPFEGDAGAVAEGKRLYTAMNCVYCHAAGGSGLMGPPLDGRGWRYGGAPAQIYNSIHDGRPQGMPAWGQSLPPESIWQIVAYVETLGGAAAPTTPGMASLGPPAPSATGPQAADQSPDDTAERLRKAGNAEPAS